MNRGARQHGFTLTELLASTAVLGLVFALAAQMTSAVISTVSHTSQRIEGSEGVRAATRMLRDELAGVLASERGGRFLNLHVREDEQHVGLYFTAPAARTTDLARLGFVDHVMYVWDRGTRTLARAEYSSAQDAEVVASTAASPESADERANLARLRKLTPAYRGVQPLDWIGASLWNDRLKAARRNPLLVGLEDWQIDCFKTGAIDREEPECNMWTKPGAVPAALRLTFTVDARQRPGGARDGVGRPFVSLIALPCVEPAP